MNKQSLLIAMSIAILFSGKSESNQDIFNNPQSQDSHATPTEEAAIINNTVYPKKILKEKKDIKKESVTLNTKQSVKFFRNEDMDISTKKVSAYDDIIRTQKTQIYKQIMNAIKSEEASRVVLANPESLLEITNSENYQLLRNMLEIKSINQNSHCTIFVKLLQNIVKSSTANNKQQENILGDALLQEQKIIPTERINSTQSNNERSRFWQALNENEKVDEYCKNKGITKLDLLFQIIEQNNIKIANTAKLKAFEEYITDENSRKTELLNTIKLQLNQTYNECDLNKIIELFDTVCTTPQLEGLAFDLKPFEQYDVFHKALSFDSDD